MRGGLEGKLVVTAERGDGALNRGFEIGTRIEQGGGEHVSRDPAERIEMDVQRHHSTSGRTLATAAFNTSLPAMARGACSLI